MKIFIYHISTNVTILDTVNILQDIKKNSAFLVNQYHTNVYFVLVFCCPNEEYKYGLKGNSKTNVVFHMK
jgi:hypothetical protein